MSTPKVSIDTDTARAKTGKGSARFRLPEPPQREPDEMTQYDQLFKTGNSYHLAQHLGRPESTLVEADRWIVARPEYNKARARRPDLLVAFGVDPQAYKESGGYVVSEQGKPPDFVLEVASERTGDLDVGAKRVDYAALGIAEYWRFDETGAYHGERLDGDRLVEGEYLPVEVEELPDGSLQGYSPALNLYLRWVAGDLVFHDPAASAAIATLESERARADAERERADSEREGRVQAEARADGEQEGRIEAEARADTAEARNRELEEELRLLRGC